MMRPLFEGGSRQTPRVVPPSASPFDVTYFLDDRKKILSGGMAENKHQFVSI
jgi:hypothetical protein